MSVRKANPMRLSVNLTEEEREMLDVAAKYVQMSPADYVRVLIETNYHELFESSSCAECARNEDDVSTLIDPDLMGCWQGLPS